MAAITWSNVTAVASALSTIAVEAQTAILAYVNTALNPALLGGEGGAALNLARIFLAAYYGSTGKFANVGAAGPVTSKSVGGISTSYGFSASTSELASNGWGKLYLSVINDSPARAVVLL